MATATVETLLARLDQMQGQLAIIALRQTELEQQIRSSKRLWSMLIDREDDIRPDSRVEIAAEDSQEPPAYAHERQPTDEELAAIEAGDLVGGGKF